MSVRNLVEEFSALKDSRCPGTVEHRLIDVLVIAICAVIAGAESWEDFALYGRSEEDWLGTFLTLPNGIPVKSRPNAPPFWSAPLRVDRLGDLN